MRSRRSTYEAAPRPRAVLATRQRILAGIVFCSSAYSPRPVRRQTRPAGGDGRGVIRRFRAAAPSLNDHRPAVRVPDRRATIAELRLSTRHAAVLRAGARSNTGAHYPLLVLVHTLLLVGMIAEAWSWARGPARCGRCGRCCSCWRRAALRAFRALGTSGTRACWSCRGRRSCAAGRIVGSGTELRGGGRELIAAPCWSARGAPRSSFAAQCARADDPDPLRERRPARS